MSGIILPPSADTETVDLDSIGPALGMMLRNAQISLINTVFVISRITAQSPQQVLTEALTQCDVTEEVWNAEPKVRRLRPEEIVTPNRAMRREEERRSR